MVKNFVKSKTFFHDPLFFIQNALQCTHWCMGVKRPPHFESTGSHPDMFLLYFAYIQVQTRYKAIRYSAKLLITRYSLSPW